MPELPEEPACPAVTLSASDPTLPRMRAKLDQLDAGELEDAISAWASGEQSATPTRDGGANLHSLGLTRDVKSTMSVGKARYRAAAQRVAEAFDLVTDELERRVGDADAGAWSAAGLRRHQKSVAALRAHQSRRERLLDCTTGAVGVQVMRCAAGHEQFGAVMTCNVRICPRCVAKVRRRNQAKVLSLLETVDELRRKRGQGPARWRFLTLTSRSMDSFAAMRRAMGRWWGKLIRRRWWVRNVGACLMFLETTHSERGWHVHIHALVDTFVPRDWLVAQWAKITGGAGQPQGQHISAPKADRRGIARELAKYCAKDLGGAQFDEDDERAAWGVAGTAERLAEFYLGSLRWRTLRTYGDAYRAAAHQLDQRVTVACLCEQCRGDMRYERTTWVRADELAALARRRAPPPVPLR